MKKQEIKEFVEKWMNGHEPDTFIKNKNGVVIYSAGPSSLNLTSFFENLLEDFIDESPSTLQPIKSKEVVLLQYVLDLDFLTTKEFCEQYDHELPYYTGDVKTSAQKFIALDAIKLKMIVEKAKEVNKFPSSQFTTGYSREQMEACFDAGGEYEYRKHFGAIPNPAPDKETFINSLTK